MIGFMACTNTTNWNLQFLTLYYTRTVYISAMIVDLRHSQNNGSTNSEVNYQWSDITPFFCTVKLTLKVPVSIFFNLSSIITPDLSILCELCTTHPTSFWNKHVRLKTLKIFSDRISQMSVMSPCGHLVHGKRPRRTSKTINLIKWPS